jgi:hypothetical protein
LDTFLTLIKARGLGMMMYRREKREKKVVEGRTRKYDNRHYKA